MFLKAIAGVRALETRESVGVIVEINRLLPLIANLRAVLAEWTTVRDQFRFRLDGHNIAEYMAFVNNVVAFNAENARSRARILAGELFMVRLDGTIVWSRLEAEELLNIRPEHAIKEHVLTVLVPEFTGLDLNGMGIPEVGAVRCLIRPMTLPQAVQYCDQYHQLIPAEYQQGYQGVGIGGVRLLGFNA